VKTREKMSNHDKLVGAGPEACGTCDRGAAEFLKCCDRVPGSFREHDKPAGAGSGSEACETCDRRAVEAR